MALSGPQSTVSDRVPSARLTKRERVEGLGSRVRVEVRVVGCSRACDHAFLWSS